MHQQARGRLAFIPGFEAGLAGAKLLLGLLCDAHLYPFSDEGPEVLMLPFDKRLYRNISAHKPFKSPCSESP